VKIVATAIAVLSLFFCTYGFAQNPRVLMINAHPDDESTSAATIYKITHEHGGSVDLCVITNGEAGYKYSTLAEAYYQLKLTNEDTGRKYLPRIRHQELENAGTIIGLGKIFFLDQRDNRYTLDPHEVLDSNWNIPYVKKRLHDILEQGHYDFVFTLPPTDSTHGHHKAAIILALEAVRDMKGEKPIVLACGTKKKDGKPFLCCGLKEFPITKISSCQPDYFVDRTQSFGFRHALNYMTIVNWEINEHKSQGTMQAGLFNQEVETFYYFDMNGAAGHAKTKSLFDMLAQNVYPELTYPGIPSNPQNVNTNPGPK
jgi:LmbE family N-acetylglucosaminyl deacetylase